MLRPQVLSWGNFVPEQSVAPQKATILLGLLHKAEIPLVDNTAVGASGICWGLWCPLKLMGTQGVLKCWNCCILQKLHSRSVMWETHLWLVERWEFKDGFPGCIKKKKTCKTRTLQKNQVVLHTDFSYNSGNENTFTFCHGSPEYAQHCNSGCTLGEEFLVLVKILRLTVMNNTSQKPKDIHSF